MKKLSREVVKKKLSSLVKELDEEELNSSATLHMFLRDPNTLCDFLLFLDQNLKDREKLLDLGGGYGFLTKFIAEVLDFKEAYNIDIDDCRLKRSRVKGIKLDVEREQLPFREGEVDLILGFGSLDHMVSWDRLFSEAQRVLKPHGYFVVSMTNLGSWDSRLSLLFGYQPRHVEVSSKYLVGVLPFYKEVPVPVGHIHTCTYKALKDLASCYKFRVRYAKGLKTTHSNTIVRMIDSLMARRVSLATRYLVVLEKIE
jgi:ubiquinone/menaquinone biosynthesis C-methylase UbiE